MRLFDGRGNEFEAVVERVGRVGVDAHITRRATSRPESLLRLTLALSPLKGDLMELVIQKATELGVSSILPVITARTDAAARPALEGSRQDRWQKVASSAAEQCGRAVVPSIEPTIRLASLGRPEDLGVVLAVRDGLPSLRGLATPTYAVTLLVGPAGGLEDAEIDLVRATGFTAASFGPRVLRAETAAVAAATAAQLLWGDLG